MSNGMHPSTIRPPPPEVIPSIDGPVLAHFSLTALQVVCALELSKGRKELEIKREFNISNQVWRRWKENPRFTEHTTLLLQQREAAVIEVLKEGELEASAVLLGAMRADTPVRHKDGKIRQYPNWEVRIRAAISLLDRQGQRGKPMERVAQANFNANTREVRSEITQALADPSVRRFLESDPAFAQKLRGELAALVPQEEPCEASEVPTSSPPPPSPAAPSSPPSGSDTS